MDIQYIIDKLLENFNLPFMFSVNVLTYFIIKFIDTINGKKEVPTFVRKSMLITSILIVGAFYIVYGDLEYTTLLNSALVAPLFWRYCLRPICKHFKINYREIDKHLN